MASAVVVRIVVVAVEADSTVAVVEVADRTLVEAVVPLTAPVAITNPNISNFQEARFIHHEAGFLV